MGLHWPKHTTEVSIGPAGYSSAVVVDGVSAASEVEHREYHTRSSEVAPTMYRG